ncbi:MAG: carbohydrate ABC transporter substrate-binding protein [Firmicutes bacterium]|nr:carbohydrate ABC transporter substrate-binding protein [Bacillota bacterium]
MKSTKTVLILLSICLIMSMSTVVASAAKEIIFHAGGDQFNYNPTKVQVRTPANPYPTKVLADLAKEWEKLNPGYKIKFPAIPQCQERDWMVAQFAGGTAPHIIFQNMGIHKDSDYGKGWVVNLSPYLEKPNPYVEGNERWGDLFYETWMQSLKSADGNFYWVGVDMVPIGYMYNADIFAELGLQPPTTFTEFLNVIEKLEAAGYVALSTMKSSGGAGGSSGPTWFMHPLESVMWSDKIAEMDVLRQDNIIDTEELVRAIKKGIFSGTDERNLEFLKWNKRIADHYPKGWASGGIDPYSLFVQGKIAMLEGVGGHIVRAMEDDKREFDLLTFGYPDMTEEDSVFGGGVMSGKGSAGYSTTWQITDTAVKDGTVEKCVDFLMFITAPENLKKYVNQYGFNLPGIKGVEAAPHLQGFKETIDVAEPDYYWHTLNSQMITSELWTNWTRVVTEFILEDITLEEAANRLQDWYEKSADEVYRQNKDTWDLSKW